MEWIDIGLEDCPFDIDLLLCDKNGNVYFGYRDNHDGSDNYGKYFYSPNYTEEIIGEIRFWSYIDKPYPFRNGRITNDQWIDLARKKGMLGGMD